MRALCAAGFGLSVVLVLIGGALSWRELRKNRGLRYGDMESTAALRARLDPGARLGVALVVVGAVLSGAASIGSLYLLTGG